MLLSVVILNYNVRNFLELCIKSVQDALHGIDSEIIVIDNNSPDDSCDMVKRLFPNVTLLENKENVGFSKANNQAVAIAKGDYVCILNPDTVVANDTFFKLLSFVSSKSKLGIVGCKLIDGSGTFLPESKRNVPTPMVSFKKVLGSSKEYYASHLHENQSGYVDVLVGAFMFLERSVYNEVGGFDEDYFMYGEDIDISFKVKKAGYQNYYFADTTVIHYKGESTLRDRTYAKRFYGAMNIFYRKHFSSNPFLDLFVKTGVRLIPLLSSVNSPTIKSVSQIIAFTHSKKLISLQSALKGVDIKHRDFIDFQDEFLPNSELIFDSSIYSWNEIIEAMGYWSKSDVTFKIIPRESNFALGSNNSKSRGDIVYF